MMMGISNACMPLCFNPNPIHPHLHPPHAAAGLVRRQFAGAFFAPLPLYQVIPSCGRKRSFVRICPCHALSWTSTAITCTPPRAPTAGPHPLGPPRQSPGFFSLQPLVFNKLHVASSPHMLYYPLLSFNLCPCLLLFYPCSYLTSSCSPYYLCPVLYVPTPPSGSVRFCDMRLCYPPFPFCYTTRGAPKLVGLIQYIATHTSHSCLPLTPRHPTPHVRNQSLDPPFPPPRKTPSLQQGGWVLHSFNEQSVSHPAHFLADLP